MTRPTVRRSQRAAAWFALALLVVAWPAAASEETRFRGIGIVMARDVKASTIVIDRNTYRVLPTTVFEDKDGAPLDFATFPVFDVHEGLFLLEDATTLDFVARKANGGFVLESARLTDRVPQ